MPLQIEVWLQQVGWPALEGPKEPSLHVLLQACGSFQELDQIAQVRVVMCSFYQCGWKQVYSLLHLIIIDCGMGIEPRSSLFSCFVLFTAT